MGSLHLSNWQCMLLSNFPFWLSKCDVPCQAACSEYMYRVVQHTERATKDSKHQTILTCRQTHAACCKHAP